MKKCFMFFSIILIIITFLSCSGTPVSEIGSKIKWSQVQSGDWSEKVKYEVKVENSTYFTVTGYVEIKAKCYDGSKFSKKVKFSEIAALSSSKEDGSIDVDNKRVTDVEIEEENFTIK